MACSQRKQELRPLTKGEREELERISVSRTEASLKVAHARELMMVADGYSYQIAALAAGMHSRHPISGVVRRFNQKGMASLAPAHAGGPKKVYGVKQQERILAEFRRPPDREKDGTVSWSLPTLQRALRKAPDGFAHISQETIWFTLHEANLSWQKDRSWCPTGKAMRVRKKGPTEVLDPDTIAKKKSD